MIFSDFTESTLPVTTDLLVGYATGGGAGSDRRYQIGNLYKAIQTLTVGSNFAGSAAIEIGRTDGNSSSPSIDFHSGATAVDYDARLIASGGTGSAGGGALGFVGASFNPTVNDVGTLGTASLSWQDFFLASGATINYANGNYILTHASALLTFETTATAAMARFQNDDAGALGTVVDFFHNSASQTTSDVIVRHQFSGKSNTGVTREYGRMDVTITDANNASEDAVFDWFVIINGSLSATKFRVDNNGAAVLASTAIPAGGNTAMSLRFSTSNIGIYAGSGAPSVVAQAGSLYLRTDGSSTTTRSYISQGGGTWTALTTQV